MENTLEFQKQELTQDGNSGTYPNVTVQPEIASKLSAAYLGLPTVRQETVDAAVREQGISRAQATLNEIINTRVEMYARTGNAEQQKVLENAMSVLVDHGLSEQDARKRLGLGVVDI